MSAVIRNVCASSHLKFLAPALEESCLSGCSRSRILGSRRASGIPIAGRRKSCLSQRERGRSCRLRLRGRRWRHRRHGLAATEVTVGLYVSDSIMGGMAAPPVRVAPDRPRRRGAVLAVNRSVLDADPIQSKLPTSRTGRASRTRSEPNRSRNRPFDPVVLCIFGRIGPFDATSSGGAMPTTTQLCVCPHRSLTGALFRNHIDLLDMMSLLWRCVHLRARRAFGRQSLVYGAFVHSMPSAHTCSTRPHSQAAATSGKNPCPC